MTAGVHLALLRRHGTVEQLYLRADALRVRVTAFQPHGDAGSGGYIAIEQGRGIEAARNQIEVAITIEISLRESLGEPDLPLPCRPVNYQLR